MTAHLRVLGVCLLVSASLGVSCHNQSQPSDVTTTVRLISTTTWPLSSSEAQALTTDELASLQAQGITLQESTLVFPDLVLAGYWIDVQGKRFQANQDGVVTFSAPAGTKVLVFEEFESDWVFGTFDISSVSSQPQPATVTLPTALPPPGDMNPEEIMPMLQHQHAPGEAATLPNCPMRNISACGGNTQGCCLDFNNPAGTKRALRRNGVTPECTAEADLNFILSTCFQWVRLGPCVNEAAFNRGPSCWLHHRYRNCQNMDVNDFNAVAIGSTTLNPGESIALKLRNNTPKNETSIKLVSEIEPPGTIGIVAGSIARLQPLEGGGYLVLHYTDPKSCNPSTVGSCKHAEEAQLVFTAPNASALPPGCDTVDVVLRFTAGTLVVDVDLTIKCSCRPPAAVGQTGISAAMLAQAGVVCDVTWTGTSSCVGLADPREPRVTIKTSAEVTWKLDTANSSGTTLSFFPEGNVTVSQVITGDCTFTETPSSEPITKDNSPSKYAFLKIDYATSPPTYSGLGASAWPATLTLTCPDGTGSTQAGGGGAWFFPKDGDHVVANKIAGTATLPQGGPTCVYDFTSGP